MTRWNSIYIWLILVAWPFHLLTGQNLYDPTNTRLFANHLFNTGQYDFAASEYEKLVFFEPANDSFKLQLISSYRLDGQYKKASQRCVELYDGRLEIIPGPLAREYASSLLLQKYTAQARDFLDTNQQMNTSFAKDARLGSWLLEKNWQQAYHISQEHPGANEHLSRLASKGVGLSYKSPWLAGGMSVIIPGAGKLYTGYWQDGLLALLFVSANAWQAYRGFNKKGIESAYGWTFASISFLFYSGNIYGAVKSAKKYNTRLDDELLQEAEHFIYGNF